MSCAGGPRRDKKLCYFIERDLLFIKRLEILIGLRTNIQFLSVLKATFNRSVGNLHGNGVLNEESNMGKFDT